MYILVYLLRCDTVFGIVTELFLSPSVRLIDGALHAFGHRVGIHDYLSVDVACRPSCRLCQRTGVTQEAFLVGIENGDKRYLGQVEAFA